MTLTHNIFEPDHCNGIWTCFSSQRGECCQLWSQHFTDCVGRGLLVQDKWVYSLHCQGPGKKNQGSISRWGADPAELLRGPTAELWHLGQPWYCSVSPLFKPRHGTPTEELSQIPRWGKDRGHMLSMEKKPHTVQFCEELWLTGYFATQSQLPRTVQVPLSLHTTSFLRVRSSDHRMLEGWQKLLASLVLS